MQDSRVDSEAGPCPVPVAPPAVALTPEALLRIQTVVAALDSSPLVLFLWRYVGGQEWPVDYVSGGVSQFGYAPDDFLSGRVAWAGVTHPEDLPRLEAEVARHHAQGVPEFFQEYRLLTKTGEVRWVDDRTFAVHDVAGVITHYAGAIRDITPRKAVQARLAEREATLRAIMDSANNSIYAVDRAYCYTGFNSAHEAKAQDLRGARLRLGGCVLDYLPSEVDRVNARRNFDRAFRGEQFSIEMQDDRPANVRETTILNFNPIRHVDGEVIGVSVWLRDATPERHAVDRLRASEEWFRALIEQAFGLIVVSDREGVIRFASANTERIMGYTQAQALHQTVFAFLHPEDLATAREIFAQVLAQPNTAIVSEYRLRHRDGRWRWVEITAQNLLNLPAVAAIVFNLRDITDRVDLAKALRESESCFRVALGTVPIVASHVDRDLRYTWIHNARHGIRAEDIIGRRDDEFLPPELAATWMEIKRRVLSTGTGEQVLHELDLGGTVASYDTVIEPVRAPSGEITGLTVVSYDITALKRAEAEVRRLNADLEQRVAERTLALQESEERYRVLAEESPNMIFILQGGHLVYVNQRCVDVLGYARDAFYGPGFDFFSLVDAESEVLMRRRFAEHQRGRESENSEYALRTQAGRRIDAILATRVVEYDNGQAVFGIITDITARREAERHGIRQQERLQRLAAQLAVAQDDEQRRIADGLHDDVAQVLTACRYRLAALHEGMTEESVRETRADLDALLGKAQQTIRSLSFELASSTLHQRELVPAIEALCQGMSKRYDVAFEFQQSGPRAALSAAATVVIFKATRELLFNVVKHAGVEHAVVRVANDAHGLRIVVEDHGRGFVQAKGAAEAELGRGLGMYQIRERLRDVGGRLRIESRPGVRTRITLTIQHAEE